MGETELGRIKRKGETEMKVERVKRIGGTELGRVERKGETELGWVKEQEKLCWDGLRE